MRKTTTTDDALITALRASLMKSHLKGPMEITVPDLDRMVTELVISFAQQERLEYEVRYHDQPRWFILKHGDRITWNVHIAAFTVTYPDTSPPLISDELYFIPGAYFLNEETFEEFTIPVAHTQKTTRSEPLKSFFAGTPPRDHPAKLRKLLHDAWADATSLTTEDLTESLGKVPPSS